MMNQINKRSQRNSSFELLRIICMLLIVMQHYVLHGGGKIDLSAMNMKNLSFNWMSFGGHIAVNCFIMISGYYLIKSPFKYKKLISLWLEITIYSVIITVSLMLTGNMVFSFTELFIAFIPIITGRYWFLTVYFFIYLLSPIINKAFICLSKKEKKLILIAMFVLLSVIPTVTLNKLFYLWSYTGVMLMCYLFGAFFGIYREEQSFSEKKCGFLLFIGSLLFIWISMVISQYFIGKNGNFIFPVNYFITINKVPAVTCAAGMFLIFKNFKLHNKIINTIATSVLGVYLIHDNPRIREWLWISVLKVPEQYNSEYFFVWVVISIVFIFASCIVIDKIRICLIENRIVKPLLNKLPVDLKLQNKWLD